MILGSGFKRISSLVLLSFVLTSCMPSRPMQPKPLKPIPSSFNWHHLDNSQGSKKIRPKLTYTTDKWWEIFEDDTLNSLIEIALKENLDIKEAVQRLQGARAIVKGARSALFPSITGGYDLSRSSRPGFFGKDIGTDYTINLAAGYELDLWKKFRSSASAAQFELDATKEDLDALGLVISANVASSYFLLRGLLEQEEILKNEIEIVKKRKAILSDRYRRGLVDSSVIYSEELRLRGLKAELLDLLAKIEKEKNALWLLLGDYPQKGFPFNPGPPKNLPQIPPVGIPIKVVEKRPDVRAAALRVRVQDERVHEKIAERFPTLGLNLNYGRSRNASSFGIISGIFWTVALDVAMPIFDAGFRSSQVEREKAELMSALIGYQRKLMQAIREVDEALYMNWVQEERLKEMEALYDAKRSLLKLADFQYERGTVDAIRVLENRLEILNARLSVSQNRTNIFLDRIGLIRAMGGRW
ncbi:efflux transporter outer membrane subunit [Dissulfuribacter thermophilus]|uniref:efflux transporter outer membrane subunit n=1 Tax=Dissulfuribacter thermophilus TaxID=1156395 RepID=UPI000834DC07|nr:TolC family protein [Dissulfuribacter thermophilus]